MSDFFNIFLIISAIQGIGFFIFLVFDSKKIDKSILFISLLVLAIALNNLQSWIVIKNYFPVFRDYQIPWHFLIAPFFYQFLVSYLKIETKFSFLFQLFLFVFLLMILVKVIGITYFFDDDTSFRYIYFEEIFSLLTSISLFFYAFHILSKKENLFVKILSFDDLKWIYTFFKLGMFSYVFWIVALSITIALNFSSYIYAYYPLRIFTTILIYWIGFQAIKQIRILNERQILRKANSNFKLQEKEDLLSNKTIKNTEFDAFKKQIMNQQLFTESKLTVEQLADKLNLSSNKVSTLIKENTNSNFTDFINQFRVDFAKQMLANKEFKNYTITAIGLEAGFNSKSSFYAIFKKFTNSTPLEFQKKAVQDS